MTFQEALKARLEIINPSLKQLTEFNNSKNPADLFTPGIRYPPPFRFLRITPYQAISPPMFRRLVALLHHNKTTVYLVSGGFRSFIEPLADTLSIPRANIYANRIFFNDKGNNEVVVVHRINDI